MLLSHGFGPGGSFVFDCKTRRKAGYGAIKLVKENVVVLGSSDETSRSDENDSTKQQLDELYLEYSCRKEN